MDVDIGLLVKYSIPGLVVRARCVLVCPRSQWYVYRVTESVDTRNSSSRLRLRYGKEEGEVPVGAGATRRVSTQVDALLLPQHIPVLLVPLVTSGHDKTEPILVFNTVSSSQLNSLSVLRYEAHRRASFTFGTS